MAVTCVTISFCPGRWRGSLTFRAAMLRKPETANSAVIARPSNRRAHALTRESAPPNQQFVRNGIEQCATVVTCPSAAPDNRPAGRWKRPPEDRQGEELVFDAEAKQMEAVVFLDQHGHQQGQRRSSEGEEIRQIHPSCSLLCSYAASLARTDQGVSATIRSSPPHSVLQDAAAFVEQVEAAPSPAGMRKQTVETGSSSARHRWP